MTTSRGQRLRGRLSINPDEPTPPAAPDPAPAPEAAVEKPAATEVAETAPEPAPRPRKSAPSRTRAAATEAPRTALEDPGILPGRKDYRSFYVDDAPFARFRAALYWLARHPEVTDEYGSNMSAAAERWMGEVASDLESRFNGGEVFRMPPDTNRRKRGKPV